MTRHPSADSGARPSAPMTAAGRAARRPVPSRSAGFSLIEVVVAVFIVSLTAMALGPMMAGIAGGNSYGRHVSVAASRVQEKVEQLKNQPYASVVTGSDTLSTPSMKRSWTVTERVTNRLKEVDLTVEWTDRGKPRYMALEVFIANRRPQ